MEAPNKGKPHTQFTRKDSFRVAAWLTAKGESLAQMTKQEAITLLEKETGLKITHQILQGVREDSGISIEFKRGRVCKGSPGSRPGKMYRELMKLRYLIRNLYRRSIGLEPPSREDINQALGIEEEENN